VDEAKRRRYRAIAGYFCYRNKREFPCRFDVASVDGGELEYFENAFV